MGRAICWGGVSSEAEASLPSLKLGELGLGGVAPPRRGVRMSSAGALVELWTRRTLLPVPSRRVLRILSGESGPYLPKTRSSVTPPVIFMLVRREISRRIWLRLELFAVTVRRLPVKSIWARAGDCWPGILGAGVWMGVSWVGCDSGMAAEGLAGWGDCAKRDIAARRQVVAVRPRIGAESFI